MSMTHTHTLSMTHSMNEPSEIWVFKICLRHPWTTLSTHIPHLGQFWYQGSPALGTDGPKWKDNLLQRSWFKALSQNQCPLEVGKPEPQPSQLSLVSQENRTALEVPTRNETELQRV